MSYDVSSLQTEDVSSLQAEDVSSLQTEDISSLQTGDLSQPTKKKLPARITYERVGVLVSDFPAFKSDTSSIHKNLIRVQDINYGFQHIDLDVRSVGSDSLVKRGQESPVIRHPDVNVSMKYLFSRGENEEAIGFYRGTDYSILKNFLSKSSTDDVNLSVVIANEDSYLDVNNVTDPQAFNNYSVMGFGNAFLTQYNYRAEVSQIPTASVAYEGSNMKVDSYEVGNEPRLASVKLGVDNQFSPEKLIVNENTINGEVYTGANAIMPGDMEITITKKAGNYGGVPLESIHASIQSIDIDVPFNRQSIYGFGSNYIFNKKIKLPIIASASIEMVVRELDEGQIESFFVQGSVYDIKIEHRDTYYHKGNKEYSKVLNTIYIDNAQIKQQAYTLSIGNQLMVSSSFSFGITLYDGLRMYIPYVAPEQRTSEPWSYDPDDEPQAETFSTEISTEEEILSSSPDEQQYQVNIAYAADTSGLYIFSKGIWERFQHDIGYYKKLWGGEDGFAPA